MGRSSLMTRSQNYIPEFKGVRVLRTPASPLTDTVLATREPTVHDLLIDTKVKTSRRCWASRAMARVCREIAMPGGRSRLVSVSNNHHPRGSIVRFHVYHCVSARCRRLLLLSLLGLLPRFACAVGTEVIASSVGAHLDSDLLHGGGTDDTDVLQQALDKASGGGAVHLLIDGPALIRGLDVYGHTVIECRSGGGLFLKAQSARALIRNAHRSRDAVLDEHIEIRNCFLNGNRDQQPSTPMPPAPWDDPRCRVNGDPCPSNKESDGTYMAGLQFMGVNNLAIEGVTLWNIRAFGVFVSNAQNVAIQHVTVDDGGGTDPYPGGTYTPGLFGNTDGLHFKGPLRYVTINDIRLRVGDDGIAFNPNDYETDDITVRNDFGPYVGQGSITDVLVDNVLLLDGTLRGFRVLSSNQRVDRIVISNVVGTVAESFLTVSNLDTPLSYGNIGRVSISNVNVDLRPRPGAQNMPLMLIDGHIENLELRNLTTVTHPGGPLLELGKNTAINRMSVDLAVIGAPSAGALIHLDDKATIGELRLSLDWPLGNDLQANTKSIGAVHGHIGRLVISETPYSNAWATRDIRAPVKHTDP